MIQRVHYKDLRAGLAREVVEKIKNTGSVIVTGAVPVDVRLERLRFPLTNTLTRSPQEALAWKQSIRDYASLNRDRLRGMQ